jgi:hypothetical protein
VTKHVLELYIAKASIPEITELQRAAHNDEESVESGKDLANPAKKYGRLPHQYPAPLG